MRVANSLTWQSFKWRFRLLADGRPSLSTHHGNNWLFGPRSSRPTASATTSNSLATTTIVLLLCGSSAAVSHADLVLQGSHVNLACARCVRRSQPVEIVIRHRRARRQNDLCAQNPSCRSPVNWRVLCASACGQAARRTQVRALSAVIIRY